MSRRLFALAVAVAASLAAGAASADSAVGVIDFRVVCGIWGVQEPTPGEEREGLCVYDGRAISSGGYSSVTWLWTWHEHADGGTTFRNDMYSTARVDAGPLGDRAALRGAVEGCEIALNLETREPDPAKRYELEPFAWEYEDPPARGVEIRSSMVSLADGPGYVCEDPVAQGKVTVGIIYTGQWPIAYYEEVDEPLARAIDAAARAGVVLRPPKGAVEDS